MQSKTSVRGCVLGENPSLQPHKWPRSPTGRDRGLKILPVWVRIPSWLPIRVIILLSGKAERRLTFRTDELIMRVSILASAMVSKTVRLSSSLRPAATKTRAAII